MTRALALGWCPLGELPAMPVGSTFRIVCRLCARAQTWLQITPEMRPMIERLAARVGWQERPPGVWVCPECARRETLGLRQPRPGNPRRG